jgi:predicted phosphodiesterase
MRVVCISDTHNCNGLIGVPDGDLLVHAGDATINGTEDEIVQFNDWFCGLPHEHKIFVAGNHDRLFEIDNKCARSRLDASITYLQDSAVVIEGRKIYGSPWQPRFFEWAFNLNRGPEMAEKWKLIPDDVEMLITHGPPNGILDAVPGPYGVESAGCEELRLRIDRIAKAGTLKRHIFGHIHCGYGTLVADGIKFVNASTCDDAYRPVHRPIVLDI